MKDHNELTGRGRGKLLLFGEHAAVQGFPAVGLSLPMETAVTILLKPGEERMSSLRSETDRHWSFPGLGESDSALLGRVLDTAIQAAGYEYSRWTGSVRVSTTVPREMGLGSSAALCAAVARAVTGRFGESADSRRVWTIAHETEKLFHGTPSGIDTGLALNNGLFAIRMQPPELPVLTSVDPAGAGSQLCIVYGAVPRQGHALEKITALARRAAEGDSNTQRNLKRLGDIAEQAVSLISNYRVDALRDLAACAGEAHTLLSDLGLGNENQDYLLKKGCEAGALGGKLSGAGGGGAFFLFCSGRESGYRVADALRKEMEGHAISGADTVSVINLPELR